MPSLAAVSTTVTGMFTGITASACSMFCSPVDAHGSPYFSSSALVRPILNISFHSHILHRGKQFSAYLSAHSIRICTPFISSDTKKGTTERYLPLM